MEKKNAFVTGGSSGIGKSICLMLAKRGYNIIFSHFDRDNSKADDTANELREFGFGVDYFKANSADKKDREKLIEFIFSKFEKIDLLVNNAGIAPPKRMDILETTEESFDLLISVNLKGPFFITQSIAPRMVEDKKKFKNYDPIIVNLSSVSSFASSPSRGEYCISKAGVSMMTKLYADRLAEYEIPVFEICPGIIYTDMTKPVKERYDDLIFNKDLLPQKRWGYPEDIAKVVDAIITGAFSYSTGQQFFVDGGFHFRRL
jgi:3-oxoacyl-[acyl-carrier protein] reductase